MGIKQTIISKVAKPLAREASPQVVAKAVRQAFNKAVDGVGPLKGAAVNADKVLAANNGDSKRAINELIGDHVRIAAAEGFATNLGGLISMAVLVPTNIAGLALLQCRMVSGIAHLRGYDLTDPRVRNAVFACIIGEEAVRELVKGNKLPDRPREIATGAPLDKASEDAIAAAVSAELIARAAGKSTFTLLGKRMPVLGGIVGGATDLWATRKVGKYAARELTPLR